MLVSGYEIRFDRDRLLERLHGLWVAAEEDEELAEGVVWVGLIRSDETVGGEILLGLDKTPLQHGDVAELVVGDDPVGIDLQEAQEKTLGVLVVSTGPRAHGFDVAHPGIVRVSIEIIVH